MPEPSEPTVRPATAADLTTVVDTVVAAFVRDPGFRFFFAAPDSFDTHARAFVTTVVGPRLADGGVWVVDDGAAVAVWGPPGSTRAEVDRVLPADVLDRLQRWDDAVHRYVPSGPFWYLGILATRPDRVGEGLARYAVAPGVAAARAQGLECWLETASVDNVAMYERRGWEVAGAVEVDGVTCTVLHTS